MNSQELWLKLYDMKTKEIQVQMTMMALYLIKDRGLTLKEIIKDLENLKKFM